MITQNNILQSILNFTKRITKIEGFDVNQNFSEIGVNSLFFMQLILFVEKEYEIDIDNQDLIDKKLQTAEGLSDYVVKKIIGR